MTRHGFPGEGGSHGASGYPEAGLGCDPCTTPAKLPVVVVGSFYVGEEVTIPVTVYANGLAAPWTGPGTRSIHKLYITAAGDTVANGIEVATVEQLVEGSATVNFVVTPTTAWLLSSETGSKEVDVWVRSFDDCTGEYTEDFASTIVLEGITFVGYASGEGSNDYSVPLTSLTGGIDTAAREGDLVVVISGKCEGSGGGGGTLNNVIATAGYTEIYASGVINDTADVSLLGAYKVMGPTPDTEVTVDRNNTAAHGATAYALVFRGVNPTTPLLDTPTTYSSANTRDIDFPAITPSARSVVVVGGASSLGLAAALPADETENLKLSLSKRSDLATSYDVITVCGYARETVSAASEFEPGLWNAADSLGDATAAFTATLNPAGGGGA